MADIEFFCSTHSPCKLFRRGNNDISGIHAWSR